MSATMLYHGRCYECEQRFASTDPLVRLCADCLRRTVYREHEAHSLPPPTEEGAAFWQWYARTYPALLNRCRQCGAQTRNPALCIDCVNDAEAGDVPY